MRLDKYIQQKLDISRNKAQMLIAENCVTINTRLITKSCFVVGENDTVEISQNEQLGYVSRSAIKLKRFLQSHSYIEVKNKKCLDIGASTGGFTQVLLEFGAKQITALDVGTSQLDNSLKENNKIISKENTDIRDFNSDNSFDIITCDVSFISLEKIILDILSIADDDTNIILLYKPQFEVGKTNLTKKNLPKNQKIIDKYLDNFTELLRKNNVLIRSKCESELVGETGNKEYFIWCTKK